MIEIYVTGSSPLDGGEGVLRRLREPVPTRNNVVTPAYTEKRRNGIQWLNDREATHRGAQAGAPATRATGTGCGGAVN
jgi:hypothetical protein